MLKEVATSNTAERNLVFRAVTDAASAAKIGFVWPFASAYKDVFAFAAVIILMAWKPTGLIAEKTSERV